MLKFQCFGGQEVKKLQFIFVLLVFILLTACGTGLEEKSSEKVLEQSGSNVEGTAEDTTESAIAEEKGETQSTGKNTASDKKEKAAEKTDLDELNVHFIDVGQADATLLQYSDDEKAYNILFDTGDWRGSEVVPYLTENNVSYLDLVIVSHPDADHIGQLDKVMNTFDVGEVWMSGNESSSQTFQRAIEAVLASNADYAEPRAGESYDIGPLAIDVLYPDSISGKANEESISLLFTYGNNKFLFTGDADRSGESYMRNNFNVDADVLHLGHHGSKTSSDPDFIDAVSPKIAVYSAGEGNSYGHPSPEVVTMIQERNIALYGTDKDSTIIITTDGNTIAEPKTGILRSSTGTNPGSQETTETKQENRTDTGSQKESSPDTVSGCININNASQEAVQEIIHIGPERAQDLIALRPYSSVDDLERINGIGPARIADIKSEGKACVQ